MKEELMKKEFVIVDILVELVLSYELVVLYEMSRKVLIDEKFEDSYESRMIDSFYYDNG